MLHRRYKLFHDALVSRVHDEKRLTSKCAGNPLCRQRSSGGSLGPTCCTVSQWLSRWATKDAVRVDVGGEGGSLKLYWAYEDSVWVKPCRYSPGVYARLTEPLYLRAVLKWQQGFCSRSGPREENR